MFSFQSGVRINGQVVQRYPPTIEAHEEDEEKEKESEEGLSVPLSTERKRMLNLGDTDGISPLIRDCQAATKTTGQSSSGSGRKIQNLTLTSLDPSNLSSR